MIVPSPTWQVLIADRSEALGALLEVVKPLAVKARLLTASAAPPQHPHNEGLAGFLEIVFATSDASHRIAELPCFQSWLAHMCSGSSTHPVLVLVRTQEEAARDDVAAFQEVVYMIQVLLGGAEARPKSGTNRMFSRTAGTILLVEDEPLVRTLFRRLLQGAGYFVIEAAGGAEALLLVEQLDISIDVLATDLSMPKMSGSELANRLSISHPELRFLFMSGNATAASEDRFAKRKNTVFLSKPFASESLLKKLDELLAGTTTAESG